METPEKKTVEEVIEKQLRDRENEEKDRQNRKNNIIIYLDSQNQKPQRMNKGRMKILSE